MTEGLERKKDLRVGADELDVRQLDPRQSVCPPMPDRKQERKQMLVFNMQNIKPKCTTS